MTCSTLTTGATDSWTGKAIIKWLRAGSKTSQATVTATLTGSNRVHIVGTITKGSLAGRTLITDLVLTPQYKTFPPTVKHPPAPCTQTNRLKKATYSMSTFTIN
jgi:hypothetical protein